MSVESQLQRLASLVRQLQGALGGNRIIRGSISSAGAVVEGAGFTASKPGTGTYTITFDTAYSDVPSAFAMIGNGGGSRAAVRQTAISAAAVTFNVRDQDAANNSVDTALDFIIAGP